MSDSRQSPIPQDRVNENIDQAQRAADAKQQVAEQERYLKDQSTSARAPIRRSSRRGQRTVATETAPPANGQRRARTQRSGLFATEEEMT
jgi:F0F1-type ATP synthase membrane subunit b/b'